MTPPNPDVTKLLEEMEKGSVIPSRPDRIAFARYVRELQEWNDRLEGERGKWQAQAETAKEEATAWHEENVALKKKLETADADYANLWKKYEDIYN